MSHPQFTPAEQQAIELYCAGDEVFFLSFRASCREQFRSDLQQGDRACAACDWATLRRVAHSMKGVLRSLGQPQLAEQAAVIERTARGGLVQLASQSWARLSQGLAAAYGTTVDQF